MTGKQATRDTFTMALDELIGKRLVHHNRPAQIIGINRSEAGHFYVIEDYDKEGEPRAVDAFTAFSINLIFSGETVIGWRLPNLEMFPRLEPGRVVSIIFNGEPMKGSIVRSFNDDRGYRVKIDGLSFTVPVLNEAIIPPPL